MRWQWATTFGPKLSSPTSRIPLRRSSVRWINLTGDGVRLAGADGAEAAERLDVQSLLREHGARPRIGHEAIEIHTALGFVAAGLGYAVVGTSVTTR